MLEDIINFCKASREVSLLKDYNYFKGYAVFQKDLTPTTLLLQDYHFFLPKLK